MSKANIRVRFVLFLALLWLCLTAHSTFAERPDVVWMRGGTTSTGSIAHSPDGQYIAVQDVRSIRLFRRSDGILVRTFLPNCAMYSTNSFRFSPDGGHILFVCAGSDSYTRTLSRISVATGMTDSFAETTGTISAFGFMPNGTLGVGFSYPYAGIKYFSYPAGTQVGPMINQFSYPLLGGGTATRPIFSVLDFSETGRIVVESGTAPGAWYVVINENHSLIGYVQSTSIGSISPNGLYVSGSPQVYRVSDLCRTDQNPPCNGYSPEAYFISGGINAFAPDSMGFVSSPTETAINFNSISDGSVLRTVASGDLRDVSYAPDSQSIVARWLFGNFGYTLRQISVVAGDGERIESFYQAVEEVIFTPDGSKVITVSVGSPDSTMTGQREHAIRIFNAADGSLLQTILTGLNGNPCSGNTGPGCAQLSADGQLLYFAQTDGSLKVYRMSDYGLQSSFSIGTVIRFALSPDGSQIAVHDQYYNDVRLLNSANGSLIRSFPTTGPLAFTNDGTGLIIGNRLYNVANAALVRTFAVTDLSTILNTTVSPDGTKVAFVGIGNPSIWNISGTLHRQFQTPNGLSAAFTPDGRYIFIGGGDGIQVWRVSDGSLVAYYDDEVGKQWEGVLRIDLSPNGFKFAYGRRDATLVMANNPFVNASIQLGSPTYTVGEAGINVTIPVTRMFSSIGTVTVDYATSDGTAAAGSDYTSTSGTITWNDGDGNSKTISIPITDDSAVEGDENFTVALSNPTGPAGLGTPTSAVVTITDNDTAPTPNYTVTYNGNGNTGGSAPVDANSPHPSGSLVTVLGPGTLTKTGHYFTGWNSAANGSGQTYSPSATFAIAGNVTLYAQWAPNPTCQPGASTYVRTGTEMSWTAAEAQAASFGGHLVTINNAAEQTYLANTFLVGPLANRPLWIGINDAALEGTFVWSSGQTNAYTNWQGGEPNNYSNEDYGTMNWHHSVNNADPIGTWNDTPVDGFFGGGTSAGPYFGIIEIEPCVPPPPCPGTPTFTRAASVNFREQYQIGLAFADFNEDGKQDIAFSTENPGATVTVRLGDGVGGFTGNLELTDAPSPWGLKAADVNNDGNTDIVAANPRAAGVSVWLGNGSGGFGAATLYTGFGGWNSFVDTGDFNEDGNLDIISPAPNNAGILFGTGGGSFGPVVIVPVGSNPVGVAVADLDSDGDLDFATANYGAGTLSIRLGDGAGGFTNAPDITVGAGAYWVKTGNFNGDAHPDLAVTNRDANTVSILFGDGSGGFTLGRDVPTPSHPTGLAVGDLNNDGKDDIVAVPNDSNELGLYLGDGTGRFSALPSLYIDYNSHLVGLADLNNDGRLDLATGNNGGFNRMSRIYLGGCMLPPTPTPTPPPSGVCTPSLTVTEVNAGSLAGFEAITAGPGMVTVDPANTGAGLQGLTLVSAANANVSIPSFPLRTIDPVTATFTVPNPGQPVDFTLRASSGRFVAVLIRAQCPAAFAP